MFEIAMPEGYGRKKRGGEEPVRVLIVDDHRIFRQGLVALLGESDRIEVVAEAGDGAEAVQLAKRLEPDVVVMDIVLPEMDGIKATRKVLDEKPGTRVIMLSMHSEDIYIREAFRSGATGYILKDSALAELQAGILSVYEGDIYLDRKATTAAFKSLIGSKEDEDEEVVESLSPRELEVLKLVAEGLTSREIAAELSISPRTVDKHRANIMRKLGVDNIPRLVRVAVERHLL